MPAEPGSLQVDLPVSAAAPAHARARLKHVCAGVTDEQLDTALLLTSELVTNALLHGQPRDGPVDNRQLLLTIGLTGSVLAVQVRDASPALPEPITYDADTENGRGLHIVTELATAWGTIPARDGHGKTVWFRLNL